MACTSSNQGKREGFLSEIDLKILWAARTVTNIDLQYESEFLKIEQSSVHEELKKPVREVLVATYRERRAPYVKLLADLRKQQRGSPASRR